MVLHFPLSCSWMAPQIHVMHYVKSSTQIETQFLFVIYFKVPTCNVVKGEFLIRYLCLSIRPSVRLSACMEQVGSHKTDFLGILQWIFLLKSVYQIHS
jgi:hypothetical protein